MTERRRVHGIVSVDPPTIRCDGCGYEATGDRLGYLVATCGIEFNPAEYQAGRDTRRLCRTCRKDRPSPDAKPGGALPVSPARNSPAHPDAPCPATECPCQRHTIPERTNPS